MIRFIIYLVLFYLVFNFIRRVFIGGGSKKSVQKDTKDGIERGKSSDIDYDDIEDANFEDMDD